MSSISSTKSISSSSSSSTSHVEAETKERKKRKEDVRISQATAPVFQENIASLNSSSVQPNNFARESRLPRNCLQKPLLLTHFSSEPRLDQKSLLRGETQSKELSRSPDQMVAQNSPTSLYSSRENVSQQSFLGSSIDSTDSLDVSELENPFKMKYTGLFTSLKELIKKLKPDLRFSLLQRFANVKFIDPEHHTIPLAGIPCNQRLASYVRELNHAAKDYVLSSQKHRAQRAEEVVHALNEFTRECDTHSLEYVSLVRQVVNLGQACLSRKIGDIVEARDGVLKSNEAKNFLPAETIRELNLTSAKAALMILYSNFKSACAEAAWEEARDIFINIINLSTELGLSEEEEEGLRPISQNRDTLESNLLLIKIYEKAFVSHFRGLFATDSLEEIKNMLNIICNFEGGSDFLPDKGNSLFLECFDYFLSYFEKLCLYGSLKQVETAYNFIQSFKKHLLSIFEDQPLLAEKKYFSPCEKSFEHYFERLGLDTPPEKFVEAFKLILKLYHRYARDSQAKLLKYQNCLFDSFAKRCSMLSMKEIDPYFKALARIKHPSFSIPRKTKLFEDCSKGILSHFNHLCYEIVREGSSKIKAAVNYYKEIQQLRISLIGSDDFCQKFLDLYLNAGLSHFERLCPNSIEASLGFSQTFAKSLGYSLTDKSFDSWSHSLLQALFSSEKAFGKTKWEALIHEPIQDPPNFPINVFELANRLFSIDNNNKVFASHEKLILVPNIVQDWKAMSQKLKRGSDLYTVPWGKSPHPQETLCSPSQVPVTHSYWILVLPSSIHNPRHNPRPQGYRSPTLLEAVVLAGIYSYFDPTKTYKCVNPTDDIYFEISQGSAKEKEFIRFFVRDLNNGEPEAAD